MTHNVWVIINSPTLHFYLDFVLWECINNNVTSMAPSLKIQERIKLFVTQCPATGYDEIYAGNTLGKVYFCLTKQSVNPTSLVIRHHHAQNVMDTL